MNKKLLKHPRFEYLPEIDIQSIYKSMLIRSNYTIKIFNNNNSSFIYSRNECVKYIFSMNSSFHYKSLTAYKAIFYFDYIMNNNTIDKENIPIIALCCYILSVKFCENDPLIPNTIKFLELYKRVTKYKCIIPLCEIYKWEVFCINKLHYDLIKYTLYDFVYFYFVHGIVLSDDLKDLTEKEKTKKLEKIYNKAREVIDYIVINEGEFCFKKKNYVIAKNALRCAIEDVVGKEKYTNVIDIIYTEAYDDNSERDIEEIHHKVMKIYQKINNKIHKFTEKKILNINIQVNTTKHNKKKIDFTSMEKKTSTPKVKSSQYKIVNIIKFNKKSNNNSNLLKVNQNKVELSNIIYTKPSIDYNSNRTSLNTSKVDSFIHIKGQSQSNLLYFFHNKPMSKPLLQYKSNSIEVPQSTISSYNYNFETFSTLSPTPKSKNTLLEKTIQIFNGCFSEDKKYPRQSSTLSLYNHPYEKSSRTRHLYQLSNNLI